jgi:L-lactate dehydrogenase complex protein LldF
MSAPSSSRDFSKNAARALQDQQLQKSLSDFEPRFIERRRLGAASLPEFEALRDAAKAIKDHTLAHLDLYIDRYVAKVEASGGHVNFAPTAADARELISQICQSEGARSITKGKSMIAEEVGLNAHLEAKGFEVMETDLGEYIIQIRNEPPSHIIAPAVHLSKAQVEADFRRVHTHLPRDRDLEAKETLLAEARGVLREKFLGADVGVTGANFLIAETGTSMIVTNEGNGDLTQNLPRVHIVLTSIEKLVPTLSDVSVMLRVLARSATGQESSVYNTFSTGPRRESDVDGPEAYHVILLDNGRSAMLGGAMREMLRCIRCGACMNHCPVYQAVGGHAYGSVYPGPMGSVLTPSLFGLHDSAPLPNASTFCGRCESVCPVRIPLPKLMRHWREREFERHLTPLTQRYGLGLWAFFAKRPLLYRLGTAVLMRVLSFLGRKKGRFASLPFASGWTKSRDFAAPQGSTFQESWRARRRRP